MTILIFRSLTRTGRRMRNRAIEKLAIFIVSLFRAAKLIICSGVYLGALVIFRKTEIAPFYQRRMLRTFCFWIE